MTSEGSIRRARERFHTLGMLDDAEVDPTVSASWKRSLDLSVDRSRPEPSYTGKVPESVLARVAAPVLKGMAEQLSTEPVALILTDPGGMVLERHCGDPDLLRFLDRALLAPGFAYAEAEVGTNGIGTALEVGGATFIHGPEHYADNLGVFSCAGAPVRHPIGGQLLGLLDITALAEVANPLLMTFAKLGAAQIQQAVLASVSTMERALLDDYAVACHHSGGVVIALSENITMINEVAQRRYTSSDQAALISLTRESIGRRSEATFVADLPSGATARLTYRPTFVSHELAGGVFRIQELGSPAVGHGAAATRRVRLQGSPGSSDVWQRAARGLLASARAGAWVELVGETGSGKTTLARAVQAHLGDGRSTTVLDARDDSVEELLDRLEGCLVNRAPVHVRHLDELADERICDVAALLQEAHDLDHPEPAWLTASVTSHDGQSQLPANLLPYFPRRLSVPPLRHHLEDIPEIASAILSTLGADRLSVSRPALQQLERATWPANIAQLRDVLVPLVRGNRSGTITPDDLPAECRAVTRRRLSTLEALERDAIIDALADHQHDKTAAAEALGISRATIYRKIKDFGIR